MQIPVNKNIDEYKDDFWKGLTLKQTAFSVMTVVVGAASFLFFYGILELPQSASLYLALPFAFPFAAAGFLRVNGMSPAEYLRKKKRYMETPLYRFQPGALLEEAAEETVAGKAKKEKVILETEKELEDRQ